MKVAENRTVILNEDDIIVLLRDKVIEIPGEEATILFQQSSAWRVEKKKIRPFGAGSNHALISLNLGKIFKSAFLVPAKEVDTESGKKVFRGQTVILNGEDLFVLLQFRDYEVVDAGIHIIFQEEGVTPIVKKKIAKYGARSFHVLVPIEIVNISRKVYIIPAGRLI